MSARDEAIRSIEHVAELLTSDEPLVGLRKRLALATLEHAKENVAAIQEVKRPRKPKAVQS